MFRLNQQFSLIKQRTIAYGVLCLSVHDNAHNGVVIGLLAKIATLLLLALTLVVALALVFVVLVLGMV